VAKTVVTQIMFRRFEVTTGNNPDRSGGFNGLAFLRGLLCCRITGFPCALFLRARGSGWEWLSMLARSQMRPTKRLTALVSRLSTVHMIDEYHGSFLHTRVPDPIWDRVSGLDALAAIFATALVGTSRSAALACLLASPLLLRRQSSDLWFNLCQSKTVRRNK